MRRRITMVLGAVALAGLAAAMACNGDDDSGGNQKAASDGTFRIVASTTQIADMARNVAGSGIDVTSIVGANQDPHDFELTPQTRQAIANADVVLRNGLGLDQFLDKALSGKKAVTVTDGVKVLQDNPHVWMNVPNAKKMTENIRDALIAADGSNADRYRGNAQRYLADLDGLQNYVKSESDRVPKTCRKLVTDHDVLLYYAAEYDYEISPVIASASSEAKPSARDLADAVARIKSSGAPAIFAEPSEGPQVMEQVAREAGVKLVTNLYGDSLGPPGSGADTYAGMMRADTGIIVGALEGCRP